MEGWFEFYREDCPADVTSSPGFHQDRLCLNQELTLKPNTNESSIVLDFSVDPISTTGFSICTTIDMSPPKMCFFSAGRLTKPCHAANIDDFCLHSIACPPLQKRKYTPSTRRALLEVHNCDLCFGKSKYFTSSVNFAHSYNH